MSEIHGNSIDENAIIENFDYEPNSDDTSFGIPTMETESALSIFTISDSGISTDLSIETVDSEEEEPLPAIKGWEEIFTLTIGEAKTYADYLDENYIDIPRIFWKLVNEQIAYIYNL
jgi:hypothetical protein